MLPETQNDAVPSPESLGPASAAHDFSRRAWQFVIGLAWSLAVSALVANATGYAWPIVFVVILIASLGCSLLLAAWSAGWYAREMPHRGRYNIAFLLILTFVLGVGCALVRWVVLAPRWQRARGAELPGFDAYVGAAVACLLLAGTSLPLVLGLLDSLVWMLVWLLRRPWLKRWLTSRGR
ncbi:MAG: hypothetical protein AB7O59_24835 [Pirellulales bacterium]